MTNKELTSLAIKIFAIYVFLHTVMILAQTSPLYMNAFEGLGEISWIVVPTLALTLLLVISWILWRLANDLIEKVKTPKQRADEYKVDQVFILHLIGFYMISQALITGIGYSISLYHLSEPEYFGLTRSYADGSKMTIFFNYLTSVVQLIIGLTLLFKPYGWVKIFKKIRGH